MIFDRFLARFECVLASFLAPKLAPNRPKIGPRRLLRPCFFKNVDFHADLRFPMFFHQNRPQDEAKIGPRSPQDGSKTVLKSFFSDVKICLRFCSALAPTWAPLDPPLGAQDGPTSIFRQFFIDFSSIFEGSKWQVFNFVSSRCGANE